MLVYLAKGERNYEKDKRRPWARASWELLTVAEGRIRLSLREGLGAPRRRTLWVIPPGFSHAWHGDGGAIATVIVFHFDSLPDPIGDWVRRKGYLELPVDDETLEKIEGLYAIAAREWRCPTILTSLRWQQLAVEWALIIGEIEHISHRSGEVSAPRLMVERAMQLFAEHLPDGWNVEEVCQALAISPAHLRRLFRRVMQASPYEILEKIRLNHAKELMMLPESKLETIAAECGYQNGSTLSRAFKRQYQVSPSVWKGKVRDKNSDEAK